MRRASGIKFPPIEDDTFRKMHAAHRSLLIQQFQKRSFLPDLLAVFFN
jgi:hypothetical protein